MPTENGLIEENYMIKILAALALALVTSLPAFAREQVKTNYILPFVKGTEHQLIQGNNGKYGHTGHAEFAFDFLMPIGTEVIAARGGKVVKIEEKFVDNTRKPGEENYVIIQHEDGTFARYYHLTKDGALVNVGQDVAQGDRIGLSGNSGASAGAHLHFDVTTKCNDWGCQTVKIEFTNVGENPLKDGQTYKALDFVKIVQPGSDETKDVWTVVEKMFTEMSAHNPPAIVELFTKEATLTAIIKAKDGKSRIVTFTGEAFSKNFAEKHGELKEDMYAPKIEVDGDWAMVWGRYVFFIDGKVSHCGINAFHLVKTDAGWKIANASSTIDPTACTTEEKARKAS
jgi:hypothetical protein